MKTRALMAALASVALSIGLFTGLQTKAAVPYVFGEDVDVIYANLVEASKDWDEINGIKVDPELQVDTPEALEARLEQGHVLTTLDPATGRITRVTKLPNE